MTELTGGLIHMNAHMVMRGSDIAFLGVGIIGAVVMLALAVMFFAKKDRKWGLICAGVMVVAIVAAVVANNQPRVKEIRACVSGPISLEMIVSVYDIKNIDGKELTLWER